jgi:hypothetical protein
MENIDRRFELSNKFTEMGMALIKKIKEDEDVIIKFSGSFLNFLSNLMYDETNDIIFNFCNMFSKNT